MNKTPTKDNPPWEIIIGLEVHVQLNTKSKLFSAAASEFGKAANSNACAFDLAMPGTLPMLNAKAVEFAIKFGLSINATIANKTIFSRKNYFYPDLPKGYQISQYKAPIISNGILEIELGNNERKKINIMHAHLEEDTGKLLHENFDGMSGIDFNRAGIPLLEIVTAPDMRSAQEAILYLKTLHQLVRYLDISNANMQEGSFRCDVNISVRPKEQQTLNPRVEIKNLNSFRFIERAINYEANRQIKILEREENVLNETRFYDTTKNETCALRKKTELVDYRYFPDPDFLPIYISREEIQNINNSLSERPRQKCERFQKKYFLSKHDAAILTSDKK
jgi:aspartyl-tRNA(Asn)/glutamyl-tRNA(Gln) amidotransferase subunit B